MLTGCWPSGGGRRRQRAVEPGLWLTGSVRGRQVSQRELDLTVGKLPPVLDDRRVISLRRLIEDLAGFAAGCIDGQLEYSWRCAGYPGCQITGAGRHVGPPKGAADLDHASDHGPPGRETRELARVPWVIPANHRLRRTTAAGPDEDADDRRSDATPRGRMRPMPIIRCRPTTGTSAGSGI